MSLWKKFSDTLSSGPMKLVLQKRNIDSMMIWGNNLSQESSWKPSWHAKLEFINVENKKVDVQFAAKTLDELLTKIDASFVSK